MPSLAACAQPVLQLFVQELASGNELGNASLAKGKGAESAQQPRSPQVSGAVEAPGDQDMEILDVSSFSNEGVGLCPCCTLAL